MPSRQEEPIDLELQQQQQQHQKGSAISRHANTSTSLSPNNPLLSPSPAENGTNSTAEVKDANVSLAVSKTNAKAISACSLYSFCSVSMILVNKSLASRYEAFSFIFFLHHQSFILICTQLYYHQSHHYYDSYNSYRCTATIT